MAGKKKLVYFGTVTAHKQWNLPRYYIAEVEAVFMGQDVKITVESRGRTQSRAQQGFYWAGILPAIAYGFYQQGNPYSPHDKDDIKLLHEFMLGMYDEKSGGQFSNSLVDAEGQVHTTRATTTGMSREEFSLYEEWCINWAEEYLQVKVPASDNTEEQQAFAREIAGIPEYLPKFKIDTDEA